MIHTCFSSLHSCFKRHSRAALNRQQELSYLPMPPQLRLYDYLQRRKERKPAPSIDLKISKAGKVEITITLQFTNTFFQIQSRQHTEFRRTSHRSVPFSRLQCVDMWKQSSCQLTVPKEIDVSLFSTTPTCLPRPLSVSDCSVISGSDLNKNTFFLKIK